jgi:hypothetical protein
MEGLCSRAVQCTSQRKLSQPIEDIRAPGRLMDKSFLCTYIGILKAKPSTYNYLGIMCIPLKGKKKEKGMHHFLLNDELQSQTKRKKKKKKRQTALLLTGGDTKHPQESNKTQSLDSLSPGTNQTPLLGPFTRLFVSMISLFSYVIICYIPS